MSEERMSSMVFFGDAIGKHSSVQTAAPLFFFELDTVY
jgi:hypothetical protein